MGELMVPIDITQEEKAILAIFSMRQFLLVVPTVVIMLIFLFWGDLPIISGGMDFIIRFIFFVMISGVATALAFVRLGKYELYLSDLVMTHIKFKRSQKLYMH
ncbi:hypothetical protein [Paenibacillus sp. FSL P4-0288]|uniref:hypothetical protein n=1 Tax=Paenibacillus sp. FSL P4-0288 TaxID=2921633 RepID=UPI0030F4BE50